MLEFVLLSTPAKQLASVVLASFSHWRKLHNPLVSCLLEHALLASLCETSLGGKVSCMCKAMLLAYSLYVNMLWLPL